MFNKNKIIIKIEGMHCSHCIKRINDALLKIDNISKVRINLKNGEATIIYKDSIDINNIIKTIEDLDYKVCEV
jgi:copper chaperone CopZ